MKVMKKLFLALTLLLAVAATGVAQNYIVVDSEKLFKSQSDYVAALESLDKQAQADQKRVDEKFAEVETLYNRYMRVRSSMTAAQQQAQEEQILSLEQQAQQFQESIFGSEGTLMQRRVELIQPIQKRVFAAIEAYAQKVGADLVIDRASNPSLLYVNKGIDATEQVIESMKQ